MLRAVLASSLAAAATGFSVGLGLHAEASAVGGRSPSILRMADEHFDYLVLGGGSGGIASARRAAAHGAKVALIERERLGGTCVNVGCVPKKVMFNAGSVIELLHQTDGYGIALTGEGEGYRFDMSKLKERRDAYVKRLNGIYANNLDNSGITLLRGDGAFCGAREIAVGGKTYSADNVLIAVGGEPLMPPLPGIEHAIDSNGFFELEAPPKRVAVVGSGYIAVELAGILNLFGSQVDLVVRGDLPLRSMEKDVVSLLADEMGEAGVNLVTNSEIVGLTRLADGTKTCALKGGGELAGYDEVIFAIGRTPVTGTLGLDKAGVELTSNGKGHIAVDDASRTSADGVYALGDVIGKVDLTPTAIAAGRLLADRLYEGRSVEETSMDYDMVPTVVFSHPPVATMGLTEEEAIKRHGADAVTSHRTTFVNMLYSREFLVEGQYQPKTRAKLVCVGPEQRVVGLHMVGLAVDEILQGFGVAMKMGATKADFDSVVAIHPTSAEELVTIPPWQAKYSRA